jgi:hypothetical protein
LLVPVITRNSVEYNLAEHCNLKCAGCDHSSQHNPPKFADPEEFKRDIQALAGVMRVKELRLVGGEPLLHPKLLDFLDAAGDSPLSEKVVLITNGLLLHRAPRRLWERIDHLIVSRYPGVPLKARLKDLATAAEEHGVKLTLKDTPQFRSTVLNFENKNAGLVRRIYGECGIAHIYGCHTIHEGRYYKCSPAPFLETRLGLRGVAYRNRLQDSVALHGDPRLEATLRRYLESEKPLAACSYCLGTSGKLFEHRQLDKKGLNDELREEQGDIESMLDCPDPSESSALFMMRARRSAQGLE